MRERDLDELRERFRVDLDRRRAALVEGGDVEVAPNRDDPASSKRDDDAQSLNEMNQAIASYRNRERVEQLAAIERALKKLREDPDDFGLCEACDEDIHDRRLTVLPWARFCIACQEKRDPERGQRKSLTDYV